MGGGSKAKDHPLAYLGASSISALINYPLWRASAMGQSGFRVTPEILVDGMNIKPMSTNLKTIGIHLNPKHVQQQYIKPLVEAIPSTIRPYLHSFTPPYKGMVATIAGMTWARAAIFYGSDRGKDYLQQHQSTYVPSLGRDVVLPLSVITLTPPLVTSIMVQCVNQPVVRASITLQNPSSEMKNIRESLKYIYRNFGIKGLWHGTNAGILKTVPKYCTAIIVKDYMEEVLPKISESSSSSSSPEEYKRNTMIRSACKSATAGIAGAILTNPVDVIRNEMFKTNLSLIDTVAKLRGEMGWNFCTRGIGKNLVAVSIPVASTIFFTDLFIQMSEE
uniref:Mitochondrial carrier protein n=1 Tax=Chaetoceros debilis TaxID=122233 RepID=A0A7S3PVJ4_9STRA|mmetsp:Transcript_20446/g.31028  ORF Transcript_20446/g.31028 Transcript_20446/m.31028 type:complete len:333 (-) Transcript_20446:90-1088(-)|eukprot:CAMPEP_0194090038 /NCGR_PEP_ID=MMETSP0149-20130528/37198_1 /TAXON_ID=122233 /ORGANISM="Chaetoceros debilis, Strain MM31A-1" /LENGTH=332 /DNA_ID=CAMNT_0038774161 /DNA_START=238 /DNA_END=1236 /DNA_ORIENTATION=+